jgi:Tfp pilus assembly protein PilN
VDPAVIYSAGPQADLLLTNGPHTTLLGKPVKPADSIRTFPRFKGNQQSPEWRVGHLDTALALAIVETEGIGGVNFSTQRSTIQHYWSEYRSQIILSAALILIALAAVLGGQYMAAAAKQRQVAELDRQIERVFTTTFPEATVVVNPLQQMQIKIREAGDGDIGLDLTGDRVRVIDILNALNTQLPKTVDIQIRRMVVGADNVTLSGTTDTFNTVDDIKGRLEQAEIFSNVTISSADLEKSGKRVRFKLKLDF